MIRAYTILHEVCLRFKWCPLLIMLSWTPGCCSTPGAHAKQGAEPSAAGHAGALYLADLPTAPGKPAAHCPDCK